MAKLARSYVFCTFRDRGAAHAACADRPCLAGQTATVRPRADTGDSIPIRRETTC
ncbi:hypothetical protein D9X30_2661 [Cupriavidus sp. U2]|nr:hypothetical protein D9X30_2661 [Cupriavidus sp. U2]